mgnify:CR=1 FL=1
MSTSLDVMLREMSASSPSAAGVAPASTKSPIAAPTDDAEDLLAMHDALDRFAALDPEKAEFVKLRYFVGMTLEQAAEALGLSERTAKRYWAFARAWLHEEIKAQQRQ